MTSSVSWKVELTSSEGKKALLPRVASPLIPKAGSPPFKRLLRDALDAKLRRDVRQIAGGGRNARGVKIIQARADHVNQSRRKRVRVAERALLRVRGLIALLEAAAVGDAAENAGNELRVVHQAEPEEQLVLVVEVDIHAGIEGVAMLKQLRRIGEVGEKRPDRIRRGMRIQDSTELIALGSKRSGGNHVQAATRDGEGEASRAAEPQVPNGSRTNDAGRNLPGGRRIQDGADRHGAAQSVGRRCPIER